MAYREEWFDVVNERDEVIRRATRREVHATGLWHRAVHVLVFAAIYGIARAHHPLGPLLATLA